jgi:hypothetical protein
LDLLTNLACIIRVRDLAECLVHQGITEDLREFALGRG